MIPIQLRPGTVLYNLHMTYHDNPIRYIRMLEQAVMELERERDALEYQRAQYQRVFYRLRDTLEELQ